MHAAVAAPENHFRVAHLSVSEPALGLVGVKDNTVREVHPQVQDRGIATEVLIGEEQDLFALLEGPRQ